MPGAVQVTSINGALDAVVGLAVDEQKQLDHDIRSTRHGRSGTSPGDEDLLSDSEPMHYPI